MALALSGLPGVPAGHPRQGRKRPAPFQGPTVKEFQKRTPLGDRVANLYGAPRCRLENLYWIG